MRVADKHKDTGWTDHERLVFLLEAARQFGSTLDEQRIYAALQHLIADAMPLDGLIVSSFNPQTQMISCAYIWSDGQVLDSSTFPPVKWKPDGTGMQSKVILTGKAEIFDVGSKVKEPNTKYVQVSPAGGPAPVNQEVETKSAMMAPMTLEGRVTGVVQAMSDRPRAYSEDDLRVLEAVVLQMTAAWHHSRLYRMAEDDRRLIDRIVETSPDIVYIFDLRHSKIVFSNGQLERQLGYDESDIAAMDDATIPRLMHPEDVARMPTLLARYDTAADEDVLEAEWRIASKSGEWRWMLNRARVFERDGEGHATMILGIATDVTDRKEMESGRLETEERYRFLAEAGTSMVWTAGPDGRIDYVNGRWHEYFGARQEFATQDDRAIIIHPDERFAVREQWRASIESGTEFECETRLRRFDGEYRWHLCRATPMLDPNGAVQRWFGISIDIDEQKEIEEELTLRVAQRTEELEAAVKELEGFTYSVSHDLRGPLRAISGASMILREDFAENLPQEAHRHLIRQAEAAKKMGALIDDLLKLSRIGRQELRPADFDLAMLAAEVVHDIEDGPEVEIEQDMPAFGDPRLIRFVLLNLIENAAKFSPNGGQIKIGRQGSAFFVADQGIGFDMQYASKLFRPFERLVRDEEYPGTGIGLANAHRIVQRHGGRIWAESEPGKGSTFFFTLPKSG